MIYVIHMIQHDLLFSSFSLRLTPYALPLFFIYIYSETPKWVGDSEKYFLT